MILMLIACQSNAGKERITEEKITVENSYAAFTQLKLDSTKLELYIKNNDVNKSIADKMRSFYSKRDFQYAWFTEEGVPEQTQVFWDLHNQYVNYSTDSSFFDKQLHNNMEVILNEEEGDWNFSQAQLMQIELQLTNHFFDYTKSAFTGQINPENFNWNIPAKKINAVGLLDSLIARNGEKLEDWKPISREYGLLKNDLIKYYQLEKQHSWENPISTGSKVVYKKGDSASVLAEIKKRLQSLGDLPGGTITGEYDLTLEQAVREFQRRHGLKQDGVIGPQFFKAINVPLESRIEQMLINMERMRWLPLPTKGTHVVANIPSFTLHVYEGEKEVFNMPVVVGKAANRTVIFNDKLEYVVFSPFWNIPSSIVRNEILPAMKRNPDYLDRNNMEITGNRNGLPAIRQKPGPGNALGKVKFIFPNRYSIYFHDTPAKSLFERDRRAFSHGCIRLKEPFRFAQYLLRNKPEWTDEKIRAAMNAGTEKWVKLEDTVPVTISYFTAWVDDQGKLNFRDDIYGHDKKMANKLFQD